MSAARVMSDAAPSLHTEALLTDRYAAVYLAGELDLSTAEQLVLTVRTCLAQRPTVVRVDVSELAFCDWYGLKTLLHLHEEARHAGTVLRLSGTVRRQLARLLDATGTTQLLAATGGRAVAAARTAGGPVRRASCRPPASPSAPPNRAHGTEEDRPAGVPAQAVA